MVKRKHNEDLCKQIREHQKDPEFLRAAYEFIRYHTGHRAMPAKVKL